jgi:DNA processing protein
MNGSELLYKVALTLVPQIGEVHAKLLVNHFGDAEQVFKAKKWQLEGIEGIGTVRAEAITAFDNYKRAEEEIAFIEKYKIKALFLTDEEYPKRLLNCYDSPTLLYYRGNADLNTSRIMGIVGTRKNTDYGKAVTEKLIEELEDRNILVISGLALGIDTFAHKAALKYNMKTVGVVGHGLDRIYPHQNKLLAKQMVEQGGLLTDFMSGTIPDKMNFPRRNRIVAGISDAVIVVESGAKGGSLITAEVANSYNRDVFAVPGRTIDLKSQGCNYLVHANKAVLFTSATQIMDDMGWAEVKQKQIKKQRELFIEMTADERALVDMLQENDQLHIDQLYLKSGLSSSSVAAALLNLEMQGVVTSLPGKVFRLS